MSSLTLQPAQIQRLAEMLANRIAINLTQNKRPDAKYIDRQEKRMVKRINRIFEKQMNWVLREIKTLNVFKDENERKYQKNSVEGDLGRVMENLPEQEALTEVVLEFMEKSLEKGAKASIARLKLADFGISFDLKNERAVAFLEEKRTLELSNFRGNIHDTTKRTILDLLIDAANSGQSYQQTAKLIREQGEAGVFSQARGELIATREIGIAYGEGNNIPVAEFSQAYPDRKVEKSWQTVKDDRVTDKCRDNEAAGWIPFDKRFSSGDEFAPRKTNPRCRCFSSYQIS